MTTLAVEYAHINSACLLPATIKEYLSKYNVDDDVLYHIVDTYRYYCSKTVLRQWGDYLPDVIGATLAQIQYDEEPQDWFTAEPDDFIRFIQFVLTVPEVQTKFHLDRIIRELNRIVQEWQDVPRGYSLDNCELMLSLMPIELTNIRHLVHDAVQSNDPEVQYRVGCGPWGNTNHEGAIAIGHLEDNESSYLMALYKYCNHYRNPFFMVYVIEVNEDRYWETGRDKSYAVWLGCTEVHGTSLIRDMVKQAEEEFGERYELCKHEPDCDYDEDDDDDDENWEDIEDVD